MKIILLGYMGSGKSTIGKLLAQILKLEYYDLDNLIETEVKTSIPEIFQLKGSIYFRTLESKVLKKALSTNGSKVLALGGGTPCYANNMAFINNQDNCISIYLQAGVGFLSKRLFPIRKSRPLISNIATTDELTEFIGKHLFERSDFYLQADHTIKVENQSPQQICEEIILKLF